MELQCIQVYNCHCTYIGTDELLFKTLLNKPLLHYQWFIWKNIKKISGDVLDLVLLMLHKQSKLIHFFGHVS